MSRWKKFAVVFAALVIAFVIIAFLNREVEPSYGGRSLSSWYEQWATAVNTPAEKIRATEATNAVHQIGTNALPFLLRRIRYDGSWTRSKLMVRLYKVPTVGGRLQTLLWKGTDRATKAVNIFTMLGSNASPAIPDLVEFINSDRDSFTRSRGWCCLAHIGDEALPVFREQLQSAKRRQVSEAAGWLGIAGRSGRITNFAVIIPDLARTSTSTNLEVAQLSIAALGAIRSNPELSLPILKNALNSTNTVLRREAMRSLIQYEERVNDVLPSIQVALNDPDASIRTLATNALINSVQSKF